MNYLIGVYYVTVSKNIYILEIKRTITVVIIKLA